MWHMAIKADNHHLISYLLEINVEPFFCFSRSCQCSPLDLVGRIGREVVDQIIDFLSRKEEGAEKVYDWIFSRDRFQGRGVFSGTDQSAFAQGLFILQEICKEYEIGAQKERALFIDLMQIATKKNWEGKKKVIIEIIMDLQDEDAAIHPLHRDILQNHPMIAHQLFPFFHSLYGDKGLVDAVESFAKPELLLSLLPQELVERVSKKIRCSCQYRVSDRYLTKIQSTLPKPDQGVRCQDLLVLAERLDGIQKDQETMQALKGLVEGVRSGRSDPFQAIRSGGEIEKNWEQLNQILCLIASNLQGQDKEQQTIVLQDLAAANKYCQTGIVSRVLTSWQLAGGVNTVGLPGQEKVFSSLQDLQRGLFVQICNSIRPGWDQGQQGVNTHVLHHVKWCLGKQLRLPEADLFFDDQFQDRDLLDVLNTDNAMQIFFRHYCTPSVILEHIQAQVNHDPGVKGAIGRMPIQDLLVEHVKPNEQSAADFYPTIYDEEGNIHLSYIAQVLEKLGILRVNTL